MSSQNHQKMSWKTIFNKLETGKISKKSIIQKIMDSYFPIIKFSFPFLVWNTNSLKINSYVYLFLLSYFILINK